MLVDRRLSLAVAQQRVRRWLRPTPLVPVDGGWLKLECQQITGAYKVRGALNALTEAKLRGATGVVCASAGNHAAGVAWAAQTLGLRATAVVPMDAPVVKTEACERAGCLVVRHGAVFDDSLAHAKTLARRHGDAFVHAFDDWAVIAGQATLGAELDAVQPDVVVVPVGGGGLAAGLCLHFAGTHTQVIGVQVTGVDAMHRALHGLPPRPPRPTWADGIAVSQVGRLTRGVLEAHLSDLVRVSEQDVHHAMHALRRRHQVIAEGAGALSWAARHHVAHRRAVFVVSGGNVDPGRIGALRHSA